MAKKEIFLILDSIRSRENVGSIFRTADGAGVSKVYLCGITPTPHPKNAGKATDKTVGKATDKTLYLHHDRGVDTMSKFGQCPQEYSDKISKTALGAEKWVPWEYYKQTWRLLRELKSNPSTGGGKLKVVGLEQAKESVNIFTYKPPKNKKIALVVGNEVRGLSPQILKYCDKKVSIPMYGKKESLNVSVAAGIALYQLLKTK